MNTLTIEKSALAQNIKFKNDELIVFLVDGRYISVPLIWFPKLANANKRQLENYEFLGDGEGIHWPDIDEDLSVEGLLFNVH